MGVVSKVIYFGADHAERRRIKKELTRLGTARQLGQQEAERIRLEAAPDWKPWEKRLPATEALGQVDGITTNLMHGRTAAPRELLACAECGRVTTACTCVDVEGKPYDWALS